MMTCHRILLLLLTVTATLCVPAGARGDETSPDALPEDFRQVVSGAKAKVFPAVVYIRVMSENFTSGRKQILPSGGSGVLISPDGALLTNWHVIDKAVEVRCLLSDGRAFRAEVVGSDKDIDIALLQLDLDGASPDLPYTELGDSDELMEGDFVMAMGAPWGLSRSVTIGIISCVDRYLPDSSEYSLWLQTDAAISPGNSGGPLVDTDGRVIGLNTRGTMVGGGLGFAVPSSTIQLLLPRLREKGQIPWSFTGLQLQPLRDFERDMYFDGEDGVIIAHVEPASPAAEAGIASRDRLLAIDGQEVSGLVYEDLPGIRRILGMLPEETAVAVTLRRGGETLEMELVPRAKGETQGDEADFPRWDFSAKTINQFDNPSLYFHRKQGVFISAVRSPGNAASSGLQRNDIIVKFDSRPVESLAELREMHEQAIADVGKRHRALVEVLRNGMMRQVVLDFSRDYQRD